MKKRFRSKKIGFILFFGLLAVSVFGFIVMILWNNVLATVLHTGTVTFWQAVGILLLSKILFSGLGGGWYGRRHYGYWGKEMYGKWQQMSPEEREKLKSEWRNRCRGWRSEEVDKKTNAGIE